MPHYTLHSDPWWCGDPGVPLSKVSYLNGQRWGSAGYNSRTPSFPTHDAAIRASLEGYHMPDHRPLSVAEVMDLRIGAKQYTYDPGTPMLMLIISFNATTDEYELRAAQSRITSHRDIAVIGALVRGERFEPGFISRVLDPAYVADELALDADAREASRRKRAAQAAQTRARVREAEEAAAARRRLTPLHDAPEDLTAEDLFSDL